MASLALATLDFLDAAYSWERSDEEWLTGVMTAARKVWGPAEWLYGTFYDASDVTSLKILTLRAVDLPSPLEASIKPVVEGYPPDLVTRVYRSSTLGFGSSLGMIDTPVGESLRAFGIEDIFGINAIDPNGVGCDICIGTRKTHLEPTEWALLRRLAAHLASAHRCRRRLRTSGQAPLEGSEIILDADARVLDARGPGREAPARRAVSLAAKAIQKVRRSASDDDPSSGWLPRVQTRWTLIATEADGRDLIVARENQTFPRFLEALTDRERQVVVCAAYGRSNKEIAYELGISHSTARVLLSRACARLGVRSREELLRHPEVRAMRGESASLDESD